MAYKNPLYSLDLVALQIAFDHAEEQNMILQPDPNGDPDQSVYLRYPPKKLTDLLCSRIPFCKVKFSTQSNDQPIRYVYHKQTLDHLFNFVCGQTFTYVGSDWKGKGWVRTLNTVNAKYWSLLDDHGNRVKNPNRFSCKLIQAIAIVTSVYQVRNRDHTIVDVVMHHLVMWMKPPFTRENLSALFRNRILDELPIPKQFRSSWNRGLGKPIAVPFPDSGANRYGGTGRLLTLEDCLAAAKG